VVFSVTKVAGNKSSSRSRVNIETYFFATYRQIAKFRITKNKSSMLLKYFLKVAHYCAVCVIGTKIFMYSAAKVETFFVNANERSDFFQKATQSVRRWIRYAELRFAPVASLHS
jgi:hypothetical protein